MTTPYHRAVRIVLLAGVFLSTAGIGIRLLEQASGLHIVFYRSLGLAAFMTIVVAVRSRGHVVQALSSAGKTGWLAGFFFAASSYSLVFALLKTTAANAMFIVSLAPFFAALFGWLILREVIRLRTWCAMGCATVGVLVMVYGGLSGKGLVGIAYAFAMAIFYGLFAVTLRVGKNADILPSIAISAYFLALAAGLGMDDFAITRHDLLICLALGVVQIGMGVLLLVVGSKHVPAAQLTFLAMLEVVLNPLWVWLGVGEKPAAMTLLGGALIFAAIAYQALGQETDNGRPARNAS